MPRGGSGRRGRGRLDIDHGRFQPRTPHLVQRADQHDGRGRMKDQRERLPERSGRETRRQHGHQLQLGDLRRAVSLENLADQRLEFLDEHGAVKRVGGHMGGLE